MRCQGGLAIFQLLTFIHIQEIIYLFGLVFRINYEKKIYFSLITSILYNYICIYILIHLANEKSYYCNYIDTECNN